MSTPLTGRRRPRNNNYQNEPPALRRRAAGGRVAVRRVNNLMAGINQHGIMMPQRLVYGNNNNNWQKPGAPRTIRTLPYTIRKVFTNNISLNNFKNKNIAYLMFRNNGRIPVLYTAGSLYGLIKSGPHARHINTINNLNLFLSRVKNNSVLFKNTQTRKPRTQSNIRKVKLIMQLPNRNRAARVIQGKYRAYKAA